MVVTHGGLTDDRSGSVAVFLEAVLFTRGQVGQHHRTCATGLLCELNVSERAEGTELPVPGFERLSTEPGTSRSVADAHMRATPQ